MAVETENVEVRESQIRIYTYAQANLQPSTLKSLKTMASSAIAHLQVIAPTVPDSWTPKEATGAKISGRRSL